jgi:hypothetical protein
MASMSLPYASWPLVLVACVALFALQRIYFELTTGARRRQMIKDNGCEPIYHYPHRGLLGKWFGWDLIQDMQKSGREGRQHEATRHRNFPEGRYTTKLRILRTDGWS